MSKADPRDELVEHLPALRAFALSLTRNGATADDMVQDTVVKAWTNIEKYKAGTNMRAWLFTILRNTYYSSRRKIKREVADVDGAFSENMSEKPAHDGHLQLADFRRAFEQLPDEPGGRLGLFLRGGRRDVPCRRRHHQEPGEQGPQASGRVDASG